jgi:hypothetical protein
MLQRIKKKFPKRRGQTLHLDHRDSLEQKLITGAQTKRPKYLLTNNIPIQEKKTHAKTQILQSPL